jgi:hypothetical protein
MKPRDGKKGGKIKRVDVKNGVKVAQSLVCLCGEGLLRLTERRHVFRIDEQTRLHRHRHIGQSRGNSLRRSRDRSTIVQGMVAQNFHGDRGGMGVVMVMFERVKELTCELSNFIGQLELEDLLQLLHILFPFPLLPCLFILLTATGAAGVGVFQHAVWTLVVILAVGTLAGRIGLDAVLANEDSAFFALAEIARATLTTVSSRTDLGAKKGLTTLPA